MKHKRKIALLSVAAIPALITTAPTTDVHASTKITDTPVNTYQNSLALVASTTTSSDTATTVAELETMVTEKLNKYESTFTIKYKGSTANLRNDLNRIFNDFDNATANRFIKEATIARDYTYTGYVNNMTIAFKIQYNTNYNTEENVKTEIKRIKNDIIAQNMTDLQKIKAIHDYVVTNATFTKTTTGSPYAAYTLLTEKKGMSNAYALVTHYLLKEAGFNSHYVIGTYKDMPHAWTVVEYNNHWYHLDTALDEPSVFDATITDEKAISYKYFLRGLDGMADHSASLPVSIAAVTPNNFKAIQNVHNPIPSGEMLYYTKEDGSIAKLSLTPLPRINIDADKILTEVVFTSPDSASVNLKAKYLVHHNGWLYFNNPDDRGYLYKVSTDNEDLTLVVKSYVRDLKVTGSSLQYKKVDNTIGTIPLVVDDLAIENVINLINVFGNVSTPNIKDVVNAKLAYDQLTVSQKAFISNVNILNTYINGIVPNSIEDVVIKIALLDEADLNFATMLENIRLAYLALPDIDKAKVYNYSDFTAAQSKQAAQATNASKVNTQIIGLVSTNSTYYADVEKVKLAFDGLTPAQQSLISNANKTKLENALADLQRDRLTIANIIYQIRVLDTTKSNFQDDFTRIDSAINLLTSNQKSLITNITNFNAAKTTFNQYSTAVNSLNTEIQAITDNTTTAQLQSLYNRYITYNAAQRAMLGSLANPSPIDTLYEAIATDFAKSNTVEVVVNKINTLKAEDTSFISNVKDARIAFNAFNIPANIDTLTSEQRASFTIAQQRLEIAEALVTDIETLFQTISTIPQTAPTTGDTFTVDYKAKVNSVTTGVDTLKNKTQVGSDAIPEDLKMTNHAEKHITNIGAFHTAQKNITDGEAVKAEIATLTNTSPAADIAAVRTKYNALTPIGKLFAGDITNLINAEVANNQAAANHVVALIDAIDNTNVETFISNLSAANEAYLALLPAQLALVPADKKTKLANFKAEAEALTAVYNAIEKVSEENPSTYISQAEAAQKAYDVLNAEQKRFITNSAKLPIFKTNIDTAKAVINAINTLTKDSTEEAILAAETMYNALGEFPRKLVTNYSKLETFLDQIYEKEKAEAVIDMIAKLDETKFTFAVDVKKAREAYEALTNKQKKYVTNLADLEAAEKKVANMVETSDVAQKMIAQIEAINNTNASFKTAVETAKAAYAAIPEAQQALVTNYSKLQEHLATYDKYAGKAKTLEDKINALSSTSAGYQTAIASLLNEYNSFNAAEKAFVSESAVKLLNAGQSSIDAVQNVTNMILALNSSKSTFHADVASARVAYNTLIRNHQTYLSDYLEEKLKAAEELVTKDRSAARKVVNAIDALSSDSVYKEIERARRVYNSLTALQRPLVNNLQTLIDFETGKLSYNQSGIPAGVDTDDTSTNTEETNPLPNFAAVPGEKTAMTKSTKGDLYTAQIYVSDEVGNSERFILTTGANVTAIIPPTLTVVGEKTGTMAIEIQATTSRVSFKATIDKKPVTFASEVDIILESVPSSSVIYRIDHLGNRVKATYSVDGTQYTIKTKSSDTFIIARPSTTFSDIQNDDHQEYIEELAARQIIQNTANGLFNPNQNITRAEFAVMIARALDIQPSTDTNFNDVKGKPYEAEVQALYEIGIIQGVSATTFNPDSTLTRQQAAMMVERMLDYVNIDTTVWESPQFTDAHLIANSAVNAVALMQHLGIVSGKADGSFDPLGRLTRSQMAKILFKALETADKL